MAQNFYQKEIETMPTSENLSTETSQLMATSDVKTSAQRGKKQIKSTSIKNYLNKKIKKALAFASAFLGSNPIL